jgi:hypothetical protein
MSAVCYRSKNATRHITYPVSFEKSDKRTRFDVLTAVKIQVDVFWIVKTRGAVVRYKRFGGLCRLHPQGILPQNYTASQPRNPRLTNFDISFL